MILSLVTDGVDALLYLVQLLPEVVVNYLRDVLHVLVLHQVERPVLHLHPDQNRQAVLYQLTLVALEFHILILVALAQSLRQLLYLVLLLDLQDLPDLFYCHLVHFLEVGLELLLHEVEGIDQKLLERFRYLLFSCIGINLL